ncbi:hypothetical protein [Actinomadura gamaensis]|uniref:Uncharacterized protein n=1 Tax=Actinomadura gamaensis TaxID=1763541 RepID=A0ABV9TVQ0_9ACTN
MPHVNEHGLSGFYHLLEVFLAALAGWGISALSTAFLAQDDPWRTAYKVALPVVLAVPAALLTINVFSALS